MGRRRVAVTVVVRDSLDFFTCFLPPRTKKHVRLSVGDASMAQLEPDWPFFGVPSGLLSPVPLLRRAVVPLFARSLDQLITQPLAPLIARSMGRDDWNHVRGALCKSANEIMLSTIVTRGFEFECHTVFGAIA